MAHEDDEQEVIAEKPDTRSGFAVVIILSILLGILLTVVAAGGVLYYQKSSALHSEVTAARVELNAKSRVIDEMKVQIESLSRQMYALKEYSIARSGTSREKIEKAEKALKQESEAVEAQQNVAHSSEGKPGSEASTPATPALPPKVKRARPEGQDCELVGKSAEDQAATLKRCVGVMDPPKEKSGSGK